MNFALPVEYQLVDIVVLFVAEGRIFLVKLLQGAGEFNFIGTIFGCKRKSVDRRYCIWPRRHVCWHIT